MSRAHAAPVGALGKRLMDLSLGITGLIVLAPLLALLAIAVRLDSPGPIIFKQERGGFRGRRFRIWKFRTMKVSAGGRSSVEDDEARITRIGRVMRNRRLDELPQLVNVILGDMSLVGPRPHMTEHDRKFAAIDSRYLGRNRARPGITGLAQVAGCVGSISETREVLQRLRWDLHYIDHWTFARDVRILARTVRVLVKDPKPMDLDPKRPLI